MNPETSNALFSALAALQTDIAVTIPWDVLHRWATASPLAVEYYAQLQRLWAGIWTQSHPASEPPVVYLYHGLAKLTLVRENTVDDPPAVALQALAGIAVAP